MRLALITQDFSPKVGGIQTYALELAKRLNDHCESFCVVAPKVNGSDKSDHYYSFPVKRVRSPETLLGWASLPNLPTYVKRQNLDIFFHTQWTTLALSIYLKRTGLVKKVFVAAHGRELLFNPFLRNQFFADFYTQYRKRLLNHVDYFFPVSDYTAALLQNEGIDKCKMEVVINGTDPNLFYPMDADFFKDDLNIKEKKILLTITRLVQRKGIDTVLEALPNIIKHHPDVFYIIVGEGIDRERLEKIIKENGLENYVKFTGKVSFDELILYYNICDVFVMPSKTETPDIEGFGLVFLEANACNKPVVGSKSGGIPSAVIDGKTGLLVDENDHIALANAVTDLLNSPDLSKQLGRQGREWIMNEANWDKTAEKIYRRISQLT